jgi:hypothetical protein
MVGGDPDQVHVLEDCEALFADKNACGVLRSALWGQTNTQHGQERLVTWRTFKQKLAFYFEGGIIFIGNRPLDGCRSCEPSRPASRPCN